MSSSKMQRGIKTTIFIIFLVESKNVMQECEPEAATDRFTSRKDLRTCQGLGKRTGCLKGWGEGEMDWQIGKSEFPTVYIIDYTFLLTIYWKTVGAHQVYCKPATIEGRVMLRKVMSSNPGSTTGRPPATSWESLGFFWGAGYIFHYRIYTPIL